MMNYSQAFKKIILKNDIPIGDFLSRVGLSRALKSRVDRNPKYRISPKTRRRIEAAFNVKFQFDDGGKLIDVLFLSDIEAKFPEQPQIEVSPPQPPETAKALYEQTEIYGDRMAWEDLPERERVFYENVFLQMKIEYEQAVRRAKAEMDETLEKARAAIRRRLLETK